MHLQNKTALVTGASRGIGRAIALRLAGDGAHVILNYRTRKDAAEEVQAQIVDSGGSAELMQADIADIEATAAAVAPYSSLDILINNAGTAKFASLESATLADYDAQFGLNVRGLYFLTQAVLPKMRHGGRIVNISSGITRVNAGGGSVYSASKSAVEAFTRAWAAELGNRGITVNTVSPGMTETELLMSVTPKEVLERMASQAPLGRLGQPDDIAQSVAFLCSPEGAWISANNLLANGGA